MIRDAINGDTFESCGKYHESVSDFGRAILLTDDPDGCLSATTSSFRPVLPLPWVGRPFGPASKFRFLQGVEIEYRISNAQKYQKHRLYWYDTRVENKYRKTSQCINRAFFHLSHRNQHLCVWYVTGSWYIKLVETNLKHYFTSQVQPGK